nr:M [Lactate dehydrogenase-elevating virus] [Lactate dehydrogenase-elevating virus]
MGGLEFCDQTSWYQILIAFSLTYTPIAIYSLKVFHGTLAGIVNIFIFINCCVSFVYLMYHHSVTNTVALSLGAVIALVWGIYTLIKIVNWLVLRCRLCFLGRSYILAPPSHVDTSDGRQSLTTSSTTAFVVRKPGSTLVNGQLVPDFQRLVLGGKRAVSKGAVNLLKYVSK